MDILKAQMPRELLLGSRNDHWRAISNEGKLVHFQKWENFLAENAGRKPCKVQFTRSVLGENESGGFDKEKGTIYLHFDSDYYEKLITLFHESRHAYQWEAVCGRIMHANSTEVLLWKRDFELGNANPLEHDKRSVERDAYRFERGALEGFKRQRGLLLTGRELKIENALESLAKNTPLSQNIKDRKGNPLVFSQRKDHDVWQINRYMR